MLLLLALLFLLHGHLAGVAVVVVARLGGHTVALVAVCGSWRSHVAACSVGQKGAVEHSVSEVIGHMCILRCFIVPHSRVELQQAWLHSRRLDHTVTVAA